MLRALKRHMNYRWQNLNDGTQPPGGGFWHGRCWLHREQWTLRFEWAHGRRVHNASLALYLGGGDSQSEVTLHTSLWRLFSYWLTFAHLRFYRKDERQIGITIHDEFVWLKLWDNPNEYSRHDPWWWTICINVPRLLFGRDRYNSVVVAEGETQVALPEGTYTIQWTKTEDTWKRPRWFAKRMIQMRLEMPIPIPVPGKGESDWDLGEDAIHSMMVPVATLELATTALIQEVERTRLRYGGKCWLPEKPLPSHNQL